MRGIQRARDWRFAPPHSRHGRLLRPSKLDLSSMPHKKADVLRWKRGHRAAGQRIAREALGGKPNLEDALGRVDELRRFADGFHKRADDARTRRDNLEFHVVWQRVRRAFGVG
jgi:hypothetical protein